MSMPYLDYLFFYFFGKVFALSPDGLASYFKQESKKRVNKPAYSDAFIFLSKFN